MTIHDITLVVVTSVLPSHPDTRIIDETMARLRHHFPHNEVILQIDGLRSEQQDRKKDYDEYKSKVLWKCLHEWNNVLPVVFEEHEHQSGMMRKTIDLIQTPFLLYIEGDCPLVDDMPINWQSCLDLLENGEANTIRFHFEALIPDDHKHLMIGEPKNGFLRTIQWSQRPHLTSVAYYRDIVLPNCEEHLFIEDTFHSVVQQDYYRDGLFGWYKHRLWIYHPEGNIKRSYTTDGREGTRKFTSDDDVWGYK